MISGWKLAAESRALLMTRFPSRYPDVVADHVTLTSDQNSPPMPPQATAQVVGEADDDAGVQALVVMLNGTTDRPDGSTYHITWSLDRSAGRGPIESNDVIRELGWMAVEPVAINLIPTIWRG